MNKEKHKTPKEIRLIVKELKETFNKISYVANNQSWTKHADELYKIVKEESKRHDNFRGEGISRGITIHEETLLFCVSRVCGYLYNFDKKPDIKNYLSFNTSCYYAFALANEFKIKLRKLIKKAEAEKFYNLDYCELI